MSVILAVKDLFSSCLHFLSFPVLFQIVGHQALGTSAEAPQQQEAPTTDPEQQRLMEKQEKLKEEQQRRQEAVIQKDRVSSLLCPSWSHQPT